MEDINYCSNCEQYEKLYMKDGIYMKVAKIGICKKNNKVVGDKYYCIHHAKK